MPLSMPVPRSGGTGVISSSFDTKSHGARFFYSLYAHLGTSFKRIGEKVECGEPLGFVGEANTPENGYWPAHLHFAIYTGPWQDEVLPGYWKEGDDRTKPEWWHVPSEYLKNYENVKRIPRQQKITP
jgi:murein DD-endopeptidase MepM/ murein hydrolase activator NlpD